MFTAVELALGSGQRSHISLPNSARVHEVRAAASDISTDLALYGFTLPNYITSPVPHAMNTVYATCTRCEYN